MSTTRVLLAPLSGMLHALLVNLLREDPSTLLVGEVGARADVLDAVDEHAAEVVVTQQPGASLGSEGSHLLYSRPRLRLVSISEDGRNASLHRLQPEEITFVDISPRQLLDVIREPSGHPPSGLQVDPSSQSTT